MKKLLYMLLAISIAMSMATVAIAAKLAKNPVMVEPLEEPYIDPLTHQQRVWLGALEWCESKGVHTAVNPNDKDNTPSYYSFQFKPGTFRGYGEKYGLIEIGLANDEIMEQMKSYEITYKIMEQMILDTDITAKQWRYQLFPGCTAKLGTPPRLSTQSVDKK